MTVAVCCPLVLWAQRADCVYVSVQLGDITEEQIKLEKDILTFKATAQGKVWETSIEFNGNVIPEESSQKNKGREYFFELRKKDPGPFWPRLTKTKQQNVKVDFSRWKDEDDESEDEGMGGMGGMGGGGKYDDASLEDMMQQMGTGGADFDPDEGCSDDSDDDDLPELEGENGVKVNGDA
jgi:prostaglandin-E synthase